MAEPDLRMAMILPSFRINVNRLVELQESAIAAHPIYGSDLHLLNLICKNDWRISKKKPDARNID